MRIPTAWRQLVLAALVAVSWCLTIATFADGEPMLAIEATIASVITIWATSVVLELLAMRRLDRVLARDSQLTTISGVSCRVSGAIGADAVALGGLRPVIYVGRELIRRLTVDELEAVIFHEDHHRRTRAPLRAAAIGGWLRRFGRSTLIRDVLLDRLADLESMADADALRRGSAAGSIARALLKGDQPIGSPSAFSYGANQRVEHLLAHVVGSEPPAPQRLPYEWLPVAMVAVALIVCHVGF